MVNHRGTVKQRASPQKLDTSSYTCPPKCLLWSPELIPPPRDPSITAFPVTVYQAFPNLTQEGNSASLSCHPRFTITCGTTAQCSSQKWHLQGAETHSSLQTKYLFPVGASLSCWPPVALPAGSGCQGGTAPLCLGT